MQLTNDSIAHLYTIPESDWTAINTRVGMVLYAEAIATAIQSELPDFGTLLTACQTWSNGTFQALIDQSDALHAYASTAIANFTALQQLVNSLADGTVTPEVQQLTNTTLVQLAHDTAPLSQVFTALSTNISNFMKVNQNVDAELSNFQHALGFLWQPITDITTALDNATGLVNGAFQAIDHDLQSAISNQIDVTMPFLESLSIDVAIQAWQRIQSETAAFPSMANDQKQLWQAQNF